MFLNQHHADMGRPTEMVCPAGVSLAPSQTAPSPGVSHHSQDPQGGSQGVTAAPPPAGQRRSTLLLPPVRSPTRCCMSAGTYVAASVQTTVK